MPSYYEKYTGDIIEGHLAKASDINIVQQQISDGITNAVNDMTEGQSWILGYGDQSDQNAFLLTPDRMRRGKYINQMVIASGDDVDYVSIRETDYRQPIKLARSSIYSVIVKMVNKSEKDVNVSFELHDEDGDLIPGMKTIVKLPKNTTDPTNFEAIFDLDYYPTAFGKEPEDLEVDDSRLINFTPNDEASETGEEYKENDLNSSTAGASVIYLYVEALNKSKEQVFDPNSQDSNGYQWNDTDPTFGLVINKNSKYGQLLEENNGSGFTQSTKKGDLHFEAIYAVGPTYKCNFGQAIIGGEKVLLNDTHVTVGGTITQSVVTGGNLFGNVLSYVYMDKQGHLKVKSSDPYLGSEPIKPINVEEKHLHIADIITYFDSDKEPLIIQDDERQYTRPRSHHERIRRLEKEMDYVKDVSIPSRFKYTLSDDDWIDDNPNANLYTEGYYNGQEEAKLDSLNKDGYTITTDAEGNIIVKVSKSESFSIPITLQSESSGKVTTEEDKTKIISSAQTATEIKKLAEDDIKRAQTFAEMKNIKNNVTEGTLELQTQDHNIIIAKDNKEAKLTEFNPWDDSKENRPADASKVKPTTRAYKVVSGKNSSKDYSSEYPAMTFYTSKEYKLKKLQIPIYKFKNCTGIKFIIWKRQGPNNKKNTVWLKKKMKTTKVFSLKNAKKKKGYLYMEDGFLIDFGKKGLTLPKGQYVIVCLPIVKSGEGIVYVDTYKPKNSKDFCIRYHGAANASHFLLKDRYQEIWYNSAKAQAEEVSYSKTGSITSAKITWKNKEPIKSIKPIINATTPDKTDIKVSVDVGGGWVKVTPDKDNNVMGSGSGESFKWKIELKGNSKDTPIIKYDKKKKYAISFEITRADPNVGNVSNIQDLTKNSCLTSVPFDANDILKEYIGDMNLNVDTDNKFSNYEFARVWAKNSNNTLLVDISASDFGNNKKEAKDANGNNLKDDNGKQVYYSLYSLHYVDLTLDDMPQVSVDYNNYDPYLEDDEHNLRLKLDTENSYNDENIKIASVDQFQLTNKQYGTKATEGTVNGLKINLSSIPSSTENQIIAKTSFENPLDLSKYSALKLGFKLNGENDSTLSGIGVYISSQNQTDVPSLKEDSGYINMEAAMLDGLPDLNVSQQETIDTYANQVIYRDFPYNGAAVRVYYKSVWDRTEQQWVWQIMNDVKSYSIYQLLERGTNSETITITESNKDDIHYVEMEINPDSVNTQYAKEIGIILINEDGKFVNDGVSSIMFTDISAVKQDYYKAFCAADGDKFEEIEARPPAICKANKKLDIPKNIGSESTYTETYPPTSSVKITHQSVSSSGEYLCHFNMTSKSTKGFNHIGLQLAADCIIVKYMLELHLRRKEDNGQYTVIEKLRIPTLNYSFYSTETDNNVMLSQIIKKLKTTEQFDQISLYATPKFKTYAGKIKQGKKTETVTENGKEVEKEVDDPNGLGTTITLLIGNIILYKAETFPLVYPTMRMKFYFDEIDDITKESSGIRKIGAVIQYR